jgi:hypothetical protein
MGDKNPNKPKKKKKIVEKVTARPTTEAETVTTRNTKKK